jgi:AsmA family protein
MATPDNPRARFPKKAKIAVAVVLVALLVTLLVAAAFPVGLLKGVAERRLSAEFGAPATIGSLSRTSALSFTTEIVVSDLRIVQPAWAGKGDFLKVARASAQLSIFDLLAGNADPRSITVTGLDVALVRDAKGNSNWAGRVGTPSSAGSDSLSLDRLLIDKSRFTLRDAKRRLDVEGTIRANAATGLAIDAAGSFDGAPATINARGKAVVEQRSRDAWPFSASLTSGILDITASGTTAGPLNFRDMTMKMVARGSSLKKLDYIIEAGLFGTQDIDLAGSVRHVGEDWFIDRLSGTIGRSRINAKATVLKRDGRTKIEAKIDAPQFDFDDLADDAGLAAARAKEARIGKRVIPDTRIDLSRMGPTDGVIRFSIARLVVEGGSVFQSLKGDLTLDHRILKLENAVAKLDAGRMTGWVKVDSTKRMPIFSTELRVEGARLETLVGQPDMIAGPVQGLVRITGAGTTIREAFSNGTGKIAFAASRGAMNRAAAFVLGQDLGGAIGQKLGDDDAMTPLTCAILAFDTKNGILRPSPFLIATAVSRGSGRGQINLDGETVALTVAGASRDKPVLKLVDPLRIGGTLSSPSITVDSQPAKGKGPGKGIIGSIGRSIGSALGLRKDDGPKMKAPPLSTVNCKEFTRSALR